MREIQGYKLMNDPDIKEGEFSQLISPQSKNVAQVPGRVLEALFQLKNDSHLVLLTDDSPYEECLYVLLLDNEYRLLDRVDIYQEYMSGIFSNMKVMGPYELSFDFLENQSFYLKVEMSPKRRFKRLFSSGPIHYSSRTQKAYLTIDLST